MTRIIDMRSDLQIESSCMVVQVTTYSLWFIQTPGGL